VPFISGTEMSHKSLPRLHSMYFPSLDQSFGNLLNSSWMMVFSSCVPAEVFVCRSTPYPRFEANTSCEASGLQIGVTSKAGSKVSRLALSRCKS